MSGIVLSLQFVQEIFRGIRVSRILAILKFLLITYGFSLIFKDNLYSKEKLVALVCFFGWFSFWEIKNAKPSLYPAFIFLASQALASFENMSVILCIGSMSLYAYGKFGLKNKYGLSNLIGLTVILASVFCLFLGVSQYVIMWNVAVLLFGVNFFYNPFINSSSHKTEYFLGILLIFLYVNQLAFSFNRFTLILTAVSFLLVSVSLFIERKKMEVVCISQLSVHLILLSKSTPDYFLYSLFGVFVLWTVFEYISRNNDDFLSKIIILIFATDLPFTPFFISKLKTFSIIYIERQWISLALIIIYSLVVTGYILVYSYQSLMNFAKLDANESATSNAIYIQRALITAFFLIYTIVPLILFKQ